MGLFETLKLEFADNHDTVLYLGNACPVEVCKYDDGGYMLSIFVNSEGFVMSYKDKDTRDTDYDYVIEQIDILMNVNREEF